MKTSMNNQLPRLIQMAKRGKKEQIDFMFRLLDEQAILVTTRNVDYALSLVSDDEGIARIEEYLFNGTQIQRNYACLYFARRYEFTPVNKAYEMGLVDWHQAYSR